LILGFHTKQLTERGTEVALFDYALAAKNLLGHEVRIFVPAQTERIIPAVRRRFEEHFDLVLYPTPKSIACDALYVIKRGLPGRVTAHLPELNHAFQDAWAPHGYRFAVVSDWVARTASRPVRLPGGLVVHIPRLRKPPVVPHIVELPDVEDDLRAELSIPNDAVVFGRHGGVGTFSIDLVKTAIRDALERRRDIWFVFLNTDVFHEHERVVHLPQTSERAEIRRFINTCDYMIHAKGSGETFGLAVAEFAAAGVPVVTSLDTRDRAHFDLLPGALLLGYRSYDDVLDYLTGLGRRPAPVESDIAARYSAERVMTRFRDVFLS
jgi:glycosyltransferase involved in cell wall biosynthesis